MASEHLIEVKLLVMDRHFLYLPLYLAQFDHPESDKLPWFGKVPPQYRIEVTPPERLSERTDRAVFEQLRDARIESSPIMFAACDPTVFIAKPDEDVLLAASLITSSAFWAVNHDAENVRLVSDLASFERILCYKEGTTSHLIARRIAKRHTGKLTVVRSTDEIATLENLGEGTVAISPEVLSIANLLYGALRPGEKRAKIVLELSTSKEFSNVLTTGLFTRREVIEKYPDLVSGVLAALQNALLAIHAEHPIVKKCARYAFRDTFHLDKALKIANSGNVFPETIQVRRDRWQRACELYHISTALADGRKKSALTRSEERTTEDLYESAVCDTQLAEIVTMAIIRGYRGALSVGDPASLDIPRLTLYRRTLLAFALLMTFLAGHFADSVAGTAIATGMSWATMLCVGWWWSGAPRSCRDVSRAFPLDCVAFVLLWWRLHVIVVERFLANAHFLFWEVPHTEGVVADLWMLGGAWVIGRSQPARSLWGLARYRT